MFTINSYDCAVLSLSLSKIKNWLLSVIRQTWWFWYSKVQVYKGIFDIWQPEECQNTVLQRLSCCNKGLHVKVDTNKCNADGLGKKIVQARTIRYKAVSGLAQRRPPIWFSSSLNTFRQGRRFSLYLSAIVTFLLDVTCNRALIQGLAISHAFWLSKGCANGNKSQKQLYSQKLMQRLLKFLSSPDYYLVF